MGGTEIGSVGLGDDDACAGDKATGPEEVLTFWFDSKLSLLVAGEVRTSLMSISKTQQRY